MIGWKPIAGCSRSAGQLDECVNLGTTRASARHIAYLRPGFSGDDGFAVTIQATVLSKSPSLLTRVRRPISNPWSRQPTTSSWLQPLIDNCRRSLHPVVLEASMCSRKAERTEGRRAIRREGNRPMPLGVSKRLVITTASIRRCLTREIDRGELGLSMFIHGRYGHGGRPGYENERRRQRSKSGGGRLIDLIAAIHEGRQPIGDAAEDLCSTSVFTRVYQGSWG